MAAATTGTDESYLMRGAYADVVDAAMPPDAALDTVVVSPAVVPVDDVTAAVAALAADGVVVLRGAYEPHCIEAWRHHFDEIDRCIRACRGRDPSPHVKHTAMGHDGAGGPAFEHLILHDEWRADAWPCRFATQWDGINTLMQAVADCDVVRQSVGVLPLRPGCPTFGRWHRDTTPLFRWGGNAKVTELPDWYADSVQQDAQNVSKLPDWYFTVFTPLDVCDASSGAVQYVAGSHKATLVEASRLPRGRIVCAPGDAVVMNGKLLHRSAPNPCAATRRLVYSVWSPPWYNEARF